MRQAFAFALFLVAPVAAADKPVKVKLGKLATDAPAAWKSEKPANRLRSYQFKLIGDKGGPGDAELIVMPESNPKPEKVFPRWKASFVAPEGKTDADIAKVRKIDGVKGAAIDILDVSGTWKYRERPFDPKSKEELKDDYRVIWVIANDGDEACHLRLSGPRGTVDKYAPGLEAFLKALK